MTAGTILKFQFGDREAIETVARSRASLWVGAILVLITTIPRNYDQTFFLEAPGRWLFGSLGFSLVSGTWMFIMAYQIGTWRMNKSARREKRESSSWCCFMGLFWMTAPIAWLYAIPVERWMDPVSATKANLWLLAVVSAWRVWLLTRCLSLVCETSFLRILSWVLFAASIEVILVYIFGGTFSKAIIAGMGGMRNSPAEEVLRQGMGIAGTGALWTLPIALVAGLTIGLRGPVRALPETRPGTFPVRTLIVLTVAWLAAAVVPQRELYRVAVYESRLRAGDYRSALDWLNQFEHADLAPSRTLPPKPFEREIFRELPRVIGALREDDAAWIRAHFVESLNHTVSHYRTRYISDERWNEFGAAEQFQRMSDNWEFFGPGPIGIHQLLAGLNRFPEGRDWIVQNPLVIDVWRTAAQNGKTFELHPEPQPDQRAAWTNVLEIIGTNRPDLNSGAR